MPDQFLSYRFGNLFFRHAFWLYRPLYTVYKCWSDRHERRLMREVVRPGMTVVDVGSNIGVHVRFLARLVGASGRVFAFEPHPENFRRLEAAVAGLPQVKSVQAAASDTTGSVTLHVSDTLNVDHRIYETGEKRDGVTVPCHRLDDYLAGDVRVDFVKMDVQGAERLVLEGMAGLIGRNREIKMILEFWPHALVQAGGDPLQPIEFLRERGFRIEILEGGRRRTFDKRAIPAGPADYFNLYAFRPA